MTPTWTGRSTRSRLPAAAAIRHRSSSEDFNWQSAMSVEALGSRGPQDASVTRRPRAIAEWSLIASTMLVVFGMTATMRGLSPSVPAVAGGCFLFVTLVLRNGTWIVHATLVALFMTTVPEIPRGVRIGGIFVYYYELFILASFAYALFRARSNSFALVGLRRSSILRSVVLFSCVIALGTGIAILRGHPMWDIQYDVKSLLEMIVVIIVAVVLIALDDWQRYIKTLAFILTTSAMLMIYASATGFVLWGRTETAELYASGGRALAGGSEAIRYLTQTTPLALAALLGGVGMLLLGRLTGVGLIFIVIPALIISVLSFSRNTLLALAGAILFASIVAVAQGHGANLCRRLLIFPLIVVPLALVVVTLSSAFGARDWIDTQVAGYANRVVAGLDESNERADVSANYRDLENDYLGRAGMEHPLLGGGFGTRYKPASGKRGEFQAVEGTLYAHNAYGWLFVKVGLFGLATFVAVLLSCAVPVLTRRQSSPMAMTGAVTLAGLSIAIFVTPMPIEQPGCSIIGILIAMCVFRAGEGRITTADDAFDESRTP